MPAIAGDAADRRQQNHPAVVAQGAVVEQGLGQHLRRIEVDREHRVPEFRGHVGQGFVAGDAGVVHYDVDAVGQLFDQLRGGIFSANIEGDAAPAEACGEGFEIGFGRGHVEQDDVGTITSQGFGDGGTDTACCAGDQCLAPGEWARPVGDWRRARIQTNDLPGHEGAFGREEKPQRAFQLRLGPFADVDQLQGATAA
ncbi:hypothetical protein D3C87_1136420 [compost metagenome]